MSMAFGWTFEHIDEFVTLPQLKEMSHFWEKSPPVHLMVAAYLGVGKKSALDAEVVAADNAFPAFLRDWVQAGGTLPADLA